MAARAGVGIDRDMVVISCGFPGPAIGAGGYRGCMASYCKQISCRLHDPAAVVDLRM
jgi:hypothetical protein